MSEQEQYQLTQSCVFVITKVHPDGAWMLAAVNLRTKQATWTRKDDALIFYGEQEANDLIKLLPTVLTNCFVSKIDN